MANDKHTTVSTDPASDTQRQKWNQRYQQAAATKPAACVLTDNTHLLPSHGEALDLACGRGSNALLLAGLGLSTQAWDLSDVVINKLQQLAEQQQLPLQACCVDLGRQPLPTAAFDVISVSGFLDRALCPAIVAALKSGGLLFYQTHTLAKVAASGGPSNPDFLLDSGELLQLFSSLQPLVYREEHDCGDLSQGLRNQAYLVGRKPV